MLAMMLVMINYKHSVLFGFGIVQHAIQKVLELSIQYAHT